MHVNRMRVAIGALLLGLAAPGLAVAQDRGIPGYPSVGQFGLGNPSVPFGGAGGTVGSSGLGSNPFSTAGFGSAGGFGSSPYGYGVGNGQISSGYRAAGRLYSQAYRAARPQTTIALQPLYDAITSVPGWNRPVHRARRRTHFLPSAARVPRFDDNGKIVWPRPLPSDPAAATLRQAAEAAVQKVVQESKSTGHGSVRLVVDAKKTLSDLERNVFGEVKTKNSTDGAALENFFHELDKDLDALTYNY